MDDAWPQLVLVGILILINAALAGSEVALISLRSSQLNRLEQTGRSGRLVAKLVRDPNRFLATVQIGVTLAGFMASATAAVSLAEPLVPFLGFLGTSARTAAVVLVTLALSFLTLVLGELAPKRLALQRAEGWAMRVGRPLHWLSIAARPLIWLLSVSTDLVVRLFGGSAGVTREEIELDELREMVLANPSLSTTHQEVLVDAFAVADRTLREVLIPRPDVFALKATMTIREGMDALLQARHSRAPVVGEGGLDNTLGIAHLRDLASADPDSTVGSIAADAEVLPGSVHVLAALRRMQELRQQMALVIDEFGGVDGIITVEDLIEELVGEIYDEYDRDVLTARHEADGGWVVSGRFPVHDLVDLGIRVEPGDYTTVSGLVLEALGRVPNEPGDQFVTGGWHVTVLSLQGRAVGKVRFSPGEKRSSPAEPN